MDLRKLRELADRLIETMADPYHHDAFSLALSDYRHVTGPTAILALLDALKNMGLDADHARQERDAMTDKIERLETQWTEVGAAANKALALAEHWKANHDHQVSRARFLIERGDIPIERVRAYEGMQTLRAVLQDILAAGPVKEDEYPLLFARAKAALDGGGV